MKLHDAERLWLLVIKRALDDICGKDPAAAEEARIWFECDTKDFRDVCEYAGLIPECVRAAGLDAMAKLGVQEAA